MSECTPNIGRTQRNRRLVFGIGALVVAILVAIGFARWHMHVAVRALVFLPLYAAALGFFQYREQTCVAFAARGIRDTGAGIENVTDRAELDAVRRQAQKVQRESIIAAALLTIIYLVVSLNL